MTGERYIDAKITDRVEKGVVFIPFHFAECAADMMTNTALDPTAKIPELKISGCNFTRARNL